MMIIIQECVSVRSKPVAADAFYIEQRPIIMRRQDMMGVRERDYEQIERQKRIDHEVSEGEWWT